MHSRGRVQAGIIVVISVLVLSAAYLQFWGLPQWQGAPTRTTCIIVAESELKVHIVDARGEPVSGANVSATTNLECAETGLIGSTDIHGDVGFAVTPGTPYTVTATPPKNYSGGQITITTWIILSAPPTAFTTVTRTLM